jgi:DNA polymerase III gamma/tau subunit
MIESETHLRKQGFLEKEIILNRLSHAYLFLGESGSGKERMAQWFIKKLSDNGDGKEQFYLWPIYPKSAQKGGKETIGIDQIREIRPYTDFRLGEKGHQIILIHRAQEMNVYAQDALLKILEEPKNQTIFILLADRLKPIKETIQSRCQLIHFPSYDFQRAVDWLINQGVVREKSELIALLGGGRIDEMATLKDNKKIFEQKMVEWKAIGDLAKEPLVIRFRFVERLVKKEETLSETLNTWLNYWRAAMLSNVFNLIEPSKWFPDYSLEQLTEIINQIQTTISQIEGTSLNKRLALEQILILFDHV